MVGLEFRVLIENISNFALLTVLGSSIVVQEMVRGRFFFLACYLSFLWFRISQIV